MIILWVIPKLQQTNNKYMLGTATASQREGRDSVKTRMTNEVELDDKIVEGPYK